MGSNEIQNFVIKNVKTSGQNCLCCIKKHPFHTCILLFLCVLVLPFPLVFIVLACCIPFVGFAFLVHRVLIGMNCRKVKNVGLKRKRWKELQSRRSIRSMNRVRFHVPKQDNESSFMQDSHPRVAIQNPNTTSKRTFHNMSAKNNLVDKKEKIVDHYTCDEGGRKFNHGKDKKQESTDFDEDKEKRHDHGNKMVRWMNDEEKNLMDLGISEVERTKRLESLMERRRSKRVSNFQIIRNAMAMGINITKNNPFLADSSRDAAPGSAPTYLVKSNPFDLPYDPHEEKPILSGDNFDEEVVGAHKKELTLGRRESTSDIHEASHDRDFAIEQFLRLGSSIVADKKDDNKQSQPDSSTPNEVTHDNPAKVEGESSKEAVDVVDILNEIVGTKPAEKAVEMIDILDEAHPKESEVDHDVSSDQSTSSYCSSDDEPILRPNKEAILHCLSMSRMRVASMGTNLRRNAESFDCSQSALFDKSKTDGFFFAANKRIHYGSTNSVASDMLVEVSDFGSASFDEDGKGSLVYSTNPSELDLNEVRLRDIDEVSENGSIDQDQHEPIMKQEKTDGRYFIEDDRRMTHDHKTKSSTDKGSSSN